MARKKGERTPRNIGEASFAVLDAAGNLIAGHNPDVRQDPASTTKMHTLQVLGALDKEGKLPEGFWKRYDQTVRRMMVRSDNEAAKILARAAMGSEARFVDRMNSEAKDIGLSATHFVTVDGWPKPEHYSTARDMAQMAYHFKTNYPELADKYAGIRKNNTAGALAGELDGVKTGTATGYYGSEGRKSMVGFVHEGTISVASAASSELRNAIMWEALGQLKSGSHETLQAHMDTRFRGRSPSLPVNEGTATARYYNTLQETFTALDAAGAGNLKKIAIAVSGVESDFGSAALFRRERANIDRYIGVYQLGTEHSQYLNKTKEAAQLRELGVLKGNPLPARSPYDPYKNQGVLGAVALMHYAGIAREVTGKSDGELTARDVWTLHLFGQNGGKALMKAAQETPNMPLKELTFQYDGRDIKAVSRDAFNRNIGPSIGAINSDRLTYKEVTVAQAFDLIQNHFDRRAANLPKHLDSEYTQSFMIASRTEQPRANPEIPGDDGGVQRIEREQARRIAVARARMGGEAPTQLAHVPESEGTQLAQNAPLPVPRPDSIGNTEVAQAMPKLKNVPLPLPRPEGIDNIEVAQAMPKLKNVPLPLPRPDSIDNIEVAQAMPKLKNVPLPLPRPDSIDNIEVAQAMPKLKNVPLPLPRPDSIGNTEVAQVTAPSSPQPEKASFDSLPELIRHGNQRVRQTENAYRLLGLESQDDRARFRERHNIKPGNSSAEFAALKGEVEKVQRSLTENGVALGRYGVDGIVGAETHAAITRYRSQTGAELTALRDARESYQPPAARQEKPGQEDRRIAPDVLPNDFAGNNLEHSPKLAHVRQAALAATGKLPPIRSEESRLAEATTAAPPTTPHAKPAPEKRETAAAVSRA